MKNFSATFRTSTGLTMFTLSQERACTLMWDAICKISNSSPERSHRIVFDLFDRLKSEELLPE